MFSIARSYILQAADPVWSFLVFCMLHYQPAIDLSLLPQETDEAVAIMQNGQ